MSTATPKLDRLADHLAEALVDRVAERLAELVAEQAAAPSEPWIDASEVARRLGLTRETVYGLADELGARRIGDGPRPRLKFDPARVAAYGAGEPPEQPQTTGNGRRRRSTAADLLPIKGVKR